jgi:putative transcriptional regulator
VLKQSLLIAIGNRIVELRLQKGWSQSELAHQCGKDKQALERIENGKINPTIYTLWEIANALEIDLSELTKVNP